MRGEVIAHKSDLEVLKRTVADMEARLAKLEGEVEDKNLNAPVAGLSVDSAPGT